MHELAPVSVGLLRERSSVEGQTRSSARDDLMPRLHQRSCAQQVARNKQLVAGNQQLVARNKLRWCKRGFTVQRTSTKFVS